MVEGQRASEGGKPPGQMFFFKDFSRVEMDLRETIPHTDRD